MRPTTILVDSQQLDSSEGMSADFKEIASREIEEFKQAYRGRFPGRDAEELTDQDLLREVMNTVGKPGKLGEYVKCVVSVSMLTEGWDANTVTHVLGVRAFGTQLLCEQVVGRALRRRSYAADTVRVKVNDSSVEFLGFEPEYAEVYGVPFSFIPVRGLGEGAATRSYGDAGTDGAGPPRSRDSLPAGVGLSLRASRRSDCGPVHRGREDGAVARRCPHPR